MSAGAWAAYRSRIAGRTSPTRSRKSPEIKPFCGHRSTYSRQAHCIKDRVLLDIACGSGIFLEEAFSYLQNYCVQKYLANGEQGHLIEIGNGSYKLPLDEKKRILRSCIYGIDIDIHAVEVAKFSLLIKLIENETAPSVADETPILPDLSTNILFGNSLISSEELQGIRASADELIELAPFDWNYINNGNPFSVGDYAEMLPILDIGEALVVGDASLLPSRIRVSAPTLKPRSATIDFWDEWSKETTAVDLSGAIEALRKQSK